MIDRKEKLEDLVNRYQTFKKTGRLDLSSEETIRTWINELLSIFGWNVQDTSQILQEKVLAPEEKEKLKEIESKFTRPDYTFKIGTQKLTFLDAKPVSVNIETSILSAFQIKSYGWSISAPCSFLTNFEEFAIYDCTYIPNKDQSANMGRTYLKIDEYVDNFEVLEQHLLKSNILNGVLDNLYSDTLRNVSSIQKMSPEVAFAEELSKFRLSLAKNIIKNNADLINHDTELLAYLTQVVINRIIFIRVCEARRIEKDGLLLSFFKTKEESFWDKFKESSYNDFYDHYDGPLFDKVENLQELEIDDIVIKELVDLLYYPSPYRFEVIPTKLLSDIYEIFLSKKLLITDGEVSEQLKLEYIKTNGAVSTPQYLVQDLLKRTISENDLIVNGIEELFKIKILDFACGSGAFLVEIFDYLQNALTKSYSQNPISKFDNLFFQNTDIITLTIEGKRQLISNCIFGVDIDPEAVEVARMSLSLKVIDSAEFYENYQEIGIHGNQILNKIGNNIKCGNTLVSDDVLNDYPQIQSNIIELTKTAPFEYNSENGFKDIFDSKGGFDFIVGNPPYVEVKNYNEEYPTMHQYIKDRYETTKNGKVDLAIAFIERGVSILNDSGKLGLIVQRRFFKTEYGKKIREYLTSKKLLSQVIEFESSNIFPTRMTYIASLILDKSQPSDISVLKISSSAAEIPLVLRNILPVEIDNSEFTIIPSTTLDQNPWNFEDAELLNIKTELLTTHGKFKDFAKIKVGIQVLWDRAYHIKNVVINNNGTLTGNTHLEQNITIECDACRPLMVNESFYPFRDDTTNTYVIFPYDVTTLNSVITNVAIGFTDFCTRFPLAGAYLSRNQQKICSNVNTHPTNENWHQFTRVQNHRDIYSKVLLPMTAEDTYATITKNPLNYCDNANMYFIELPNKSDDNLYAVTGIINSTLFSVLARSIALTQQGGYFKFNKQFIDPIPFPKTNFTTKTSLVTEISDLAKNIEQNQKGYSRLSDRAKNARKLILKNDWRLLDLKVYELYDLTPNQITFFNGKGRNIDRIEILER